MITQEVFDGAYRALSDRAADLHAVLGRCPAVWVDDAALAVLTGLDAQTVASAVGELVAGGFAGHVDGGAVAPSMSGTLHGSEPRRRGGAPEHVEAAVARWITWMRGCAAAVDAMLVATRRGPFTGWAAAPVGRLPFASSERAALEWTGRQLPNYIALIKTASGCGQWELVCELAYLLWPAWQRLHAKERVEVLELGLAAALALGDGHSEMQMCTTLGGVLRPLDPRRAAGLHARAEQLAADLGRDRRALAQAVSAQAKDARAAGWLERAEQFARRARVLREQAADRRGVGLSELDLARIARESGEIDRAAAGFHTAFHLLGDAGDTFDTWLALAEHGEAIARCGRLDEGLERIERARGHLAENGSVFGQVRVLETRARTLERAGRCDQASAGLERAAELITPWDPDHAARLRRSTAVQAR